MAETLHLQVVAPERVLVDEQVTEAQIPALEGYIGVLPGHAPLLSMLKPGGVLSYVVGGQTKKLAVYGGFVEVLPEGAKVLVDAAQFSTEINREQAQARLAAANKAAEQASPDVDPKVSMDELAKAQAAFETLI